MMYRQSATYFGDVQKMLARALYDDGKTDTEIGLEIGVSVNNIIHWRREEGLREHVKGERPHTPPIKREPVTAPRPVPPAARQARDDRLITPAAALAAHVAPAKPTGDNAIDIGTYLGEPALVDLEELLTTRLLIQGNSGSGKSHLLRRLLEECAGIVQQIIVDPEGDFVSFGPTFGHTVVEAKDTTAGRLATIARRTRELRGSVVLSLEGVEADEQLEKVAAFLGGLFEAPPEHWHPAIVAVDEAHLYAPAGDNGEDKDVRKASQQAMANLMCRGRKRGLAGIIATQRLSKLHKNVAAEASNFLLGRTFLDIDIARAVDLLGIRGTQAEDIRNLNRGEFLGLGPAIARRPMKVKIGAVQTQGRAGAEKGLTALPTMTAEEMQALLLADEEEQAAPRLKVVK
jgi:hypothetical protein